MSGNPGEADMSGSAWLHALDVRVVSALARSCVILALLACVPGSPAEGSVAKLRVATRVVPPMVIEDKGALRGFSIDLWNSISSRLNRETEYLVMSDVGELLDAVGDGRADLGIAAISITSERESRFDFSQPILNAGLQILVRGATGNAEPSPVHLIRLFFSCTLLIWLGIALLLIIIPAHLVWVVERHHRNGIIPSRNYFPGIFHAMFWAAGTLATQADHMPRPGLLPCSGCLRRWCL
jgi:polar amino acid transport system substrate-binding protein